MIQLAVRKDLRNLPGLRAMTRLPTTPCSSLFLYCPKKANGYVYLVHLQIVVPLQHCIMNATLNIESPWKTYPRTVLAILPALAAWCFTLVLLIPKLKETWYRASFDDSTALGILTVFVSLASHWFAVGIALAVLLALLEWRSKLWRRHRRQVMGVAVFLFNTAILFFITAMLAYGLMAASR